MSKINIIFQNHFNILIFFLLFRLGIDELKNDGF